MLRALVKTAKVAVMGAVTLAVATKAKEWTDRQLDKVVPK